MARQGNKMIMTMGGRPDSAIFAADGIDSRFAVLYPVKGENLKMYNRVDDHDVALEIHASEANDIRVTVEIDGQIVELLGHIQPVDDKGECYMEDSETQLPILAGLVDVIWPDGTIEHWDRSQLVAMMGMKSEESLQWLAEELNRRSGARR